MQQNIGKTSPQIPTDILSRMESSIKETISILEERYPTIDGRYPIDETNNSEIRWCYIDGVRKKVLAYCDDMTPIRDIRTLKVGLRIEVYQYLPSFIKLIRNIDKQRREKFEATAKTVEELLMQIKEEDFDGNSLTETDGNK